MFRKKQTRGHTNEIKRDKATKKKKQKKKKKREKKKNCLRESIIAIGCCFMTDVSIYI